MSKKKYKGLSEEEFEEMLANEPYLYYLTVLGDAPIIKNNITFSMGQAKKHYDTLMQQAIDAWNEAKTTHKKKEAADMALSLSIVQLRIH